MAISMKSAADIAKKFIRVTPERTEDYEQGVRNPLNDWEKNTLAAEENYEAGIKASMLQKRFGKGVKKIGTAGQKAATIIKGIGRWPEGVRLAEEAYRKGMEPVVNVLKALTLPKRYPKGDPRNIKRVEAVQKALHDLKIGA